MVTVIGRPCGPITSGGRWVVTVIGWLASSAPIINRDGDMGTVVGRPLCSSWASLVAQLVKNPPAMQETPVQSLGQEDLLEKE